MRFKLSTLTLSLLLYGAASFAQNVMKDEIDAFAAKTGAVPTIDKATNSLNFLRFPTGRALKLTGVTPQEKALSFLKQNSGLFAMQADADSYLVKESKKDNYGLEHVVLQQYYKGIPVFDATMKFHFNKNTDLTSLNGNFIPIIKLNTTPYVTQEEAGREALKRVTGQKMGSFKAPLKINKTTLYVFQKGLAQGYSGAKYLVYEVEVRNDADVREFVYIDAQSKAIVEQFSGMHNIYRILYEGFADGENKKWEEGDALPGKLNQWQQSEVRSSGHIYNLMKNTFNYDSYDNAGAIMATVNNNPEIDCPNATWNGITANFCNGTATDDIVAHEWAHAYTEHTSGLIYAWQAGALNEAYSDIWGETVDQLNDYMDSGENNALRTGCGSSTRWEVGEKATAFNGALRDMWDPTCKGAPGKVSDSQYWCDGWDVGGVHTNSGILNHAYALLVDGGTYNGQTITGLGLTKAAHIFWHAQTNYMSNTTDFAAQADNLEASLTDLIGINLMSLSTGNDPTALSGQTITMADAQQLKNVLAAVELRKDNNCEFRRILEPLAAICSGASSDNAIFYDNFESGMSAWSVSNAGGARTWIPRNWKLEASAPGGRAGQVVYGANTQIGDCSTNSQNGLISFTSPVISIPTGSSGPYNMAFDHYIATEAGYDGGNVSYKINNEAWKVVPASAFTANGYNSTLYPFSGNPLENQPAFSGVDEGSSVTSHWGQSRIDLTVLGLEAGEKIQFRWDLGTDGCGGVDGWYIDDVRVYSCAMPTVQFASNATIVNEGEANMPGISPRECLKYIEKTVTVKINKAPSAPVTVTFSTSGTATRGASADYSIVPASVILKAGTLSRDVVVRIYNDAYVEGNETVSLSYTLTGSGNAYPETNSQEHILTIVDDDIAPEEGITILNLLSADFNTGLPDGWEYIDGEDYPYSWTVIKYPKNPLDPAGPPYLFVNSDEADRVQLDAIVESAPFNTVGLSRIDLSFLEYFLVWGGKFDEQALVDVWDGSEWHNLLTQNETTGTSGSWRKPTQRNISIPIEYANPAMKIRFRYIADYDLWWAIDNVKVTGRIPTEIESKITTTPDAQYLGANATAYFYDPQTKNLIAKIKNLSSFNYGCTTVQIDRAGADETSWMGSYHITNKTFKVTPSTNNPNGRFEITLYYKASELPNFNGDNIRSMGKSENGIGPDNNAETSKTSILTSSEFGSDYAFTAVFDSGFSGFGLSDAPPSGALPVTLVNFRGKHTAEGNLLNWTTTAEVNNDYFAIEKSLNGRDFTQAGKVEGSNNSAVENQYRFTDTDYAKGISYYRLKQVDHNGTFAYSRIISVNALNSKDLKFFPNPVQSLLTIELPDAETKAVDIKIMNTAGQEILAKNNVKVKNGSFKFDMSNLHSGIYQVIVSGKQDAGQKKDFHLSVFKL